MIDLVLVTVLLVAVGYFPARLLCRDPVWSFLAAPLATGAMAGIAVTLMIIAETPMWTAIALVAIGAGTSALAVYRRRPPRPEGATPRLALFLPLGAVIPLLTLQRLPIGWDARSIWWFHARWYLLGGGATRDAMRNVAFVYAQLNTPLITNPPFSQPDYPPLGSAATAGVWWLSGDQSLRVAQYVIALLTVSAVVLFAESLRRALVDRGWGRTLSVGIGTLGVLALYGIVGVGYSTIAPATNGYVDVLWAGAIGAACVQLLVLPRSAQALRLGSFCLLVASLTKNEGMAAAVIVAVLVCVRYRLAQRVWAWMAAALAPGALWFVTVLALGVPSENRDGSLTGALLRGESEAWDRVRPTLNAMLHEVRYLLPLAVVATIVGVLLTRHRSSIWTASMWLWAAWLGMVTTIAFVYVTSHAGLDYHLDLSSDRTMIAPNFILFAQCLLWSGAAISVLRGDPNEHRRRASRAPAMSMAE